MAFISQNAQLPVGAGECQGLGLALQVHFPNLCSGHLREEVQKAQFSVEETGLGKGGGWPRSHKDRAQCLGPQGRTCHSDHLEASCRGRRVLALEYPVYSLTSAV